MVSRSRGNSVEDGSNPLKRLLPALALVMATLSFAACEDRFDRIERLETEANTVEELSQEAQRSLDGGRYTEAARLLDEIDRQFPTSPEAPRALVLAGRYYFEDQEYELAASILSRFIRDHGGHPDIAYAYYLRGVAGYRSVSDVDKDEGDTAAAESYLRAIIDEFSGTDYALDAGVKLNAIKNQRAAKELVTGKFYHHRREYLAALNRYQTVVQNYPDSTYVEEALYRVIEVYKVLGLNGEAKNTAVVLGHNFPGSEWYHKAYEIVEGDLPAHIESGGRGFWGSLNPFG